MFESHNRLITKPNLASPVSGGRLATAQPSAEQAVAGVGLLELSSPSPLRHSSLGEALDYFELRAKFLGKIRFHLEKMRDLARSNAEDKLDEDRSQAYYHHACTVRQIVATDYNGSPLFARAGIVARAGDDETQLVMEGLDLSHPAIASATQTTITGKEEARAAGQSLRKALRYLTVVESGLEAHLSRLSFLNERLELAPGD